MEFMPEDTQLNEQDVHQSNMYNIEKTGNYLCSTNTL